MRMEDSERTGDLSLAYDKSRMIVSRIQSSSMQRYFPSSCYSSVFVLISLLLLVVSSDPTCAQQQQDDSSRQCTAVPDDHDGENGSVCSSRSAQCGLYMAESSIPNAGWGIFTGKKLKEKEYFNPRDVVVDVYDIRQHIRQSREAMAGAYGSIPFGAANHHGKKDDDDNDHVLLPDWLFKHYEWEGFEVKSQFSADFVRCILPGFGMLANSHTSLYNAYDFGSMETVYSSRRSEEIRGLGNETMVRSRHTPSTGAHSHIHSLTFGVMEDLEAGQEIFVEYGDHYFEDRAHAFGHLPLSFDFTHADNFLQQWLKVSGGGANHTQLAEDLWDLTMELGFDKIWNDNDSVEKKRLRNALPSTGKEAFDWLGKWPNRTTAKASVPNSVRSLEWLDENGYCLDNIRVEHTNSHDGERNDDYNDNDNINTTKVGISKGKGAFATRFLKNGTMVSPAPVIHLSRDHLRMRWIEPQDAKVKSVLWENYQLLLNYCYGHPASSLLFFPYSNAVNLINHGRPANVALRWASKDKMPKPEMLNWTVAKVIEYNAHAGLLMEIYALRDIKEGEEIVLDYGDDWQRSWNQHVENWIPPVHADDYKAPAYYNQLDKLYTEQDNELPAYIQTRCWVDVDDSRARDKDGFFEPFFLETDDFDQTVACKVLELQQADDSRPPDEILYTVWLEEMKVMVKNVDRKYITYVDLEYTNDQHLRQGFRHEIQLPDEMVPFNWRDLAAAPSPTVGDDEADSESCGLYMAESSIPGAGLGMFTSRAISKRERMFYGEVVIPVEDIEINMRLRHWMHGEFEYDEDDDNDWILDLYHWNALMINLQFEAGDVQTIVPGLGMLANSHTGLINARLTPPGQTTDLHRAKNPGTGASTNYHDLHYTATRHLEVGAELYVDYTDSYFKGIDYLAAVPLSTDFVKADNILKKFKAEVGGDFDSEKSHEAWDVLLETHGENVRLSSALPKQLGDVPRVLEVGTAEYSVPDRVRPIEWLKQNGKCLDNIRPSRSRIWEAGHGAFATRLLAKGDVVVPMPLVQMHRKHMEIYDSDDISDKDAEVRRVGTQLLQNYCYGHNESNLLLFPYSPVVNYINHNATHYNAKLQWSDLPNHNREWLEQSPNELIRKGHAGLIMELVATRDIDMGEEILISYGDSWDSAWKDHVQKWEQQRQDNEHDSSYVSAAQLNERVEWLLTMEEEERDPYPFNVNTGCFLSRDILHEHKAHPGKAVKWRYNHGMYDSGHHVLPCAVVKRMPVYDYDPDIIHARRDSNRPINLKYNVIIEPEYENEENEDDKDHPSPSFVVTGVPRKAIRFYDHMYTSDMFLRNAFRHEIHLPDEMVPAAWRDRIGDDKEE